MRPRTCVDSRRMRLRGLALILAGLTAATARADESPPVPAAPDVIEFFERQVRPVLADNCFKCHGPDKQEGGLRLTSRVSILKGGDTGPAIVPGQPEDSELITAINYGADGYQMPPTGKLSDAHIAALTEWVRSGAPWPEDQPQASAGDEQGIDLAERAKHWSFRPVEPHAPPAVQRIDWPTTPLDRFILSQLESAGVAPAPDADKRTLLRRVTFDLIGLPPTLDEIRDFLADSSPDAYAKVVDRLLASPRYGERWGRHWLDLVRFAETGGHEFDYDIRHAWRYRDYVIRALNADVPYDDFIIEHIAGDLLESPRTEPVTGSNESIVGTGFYWFGQGKHSPVDLRAEECDSVDNQLDVLGKTFLGLTIACARCHDHKFDPITTRDYYALAGFLQSSRQQYADVNPPNATDEIERALAQLAAQHAPGLIAASAEQLRGAVRWLESTFAADLDPPGPPSAGPASVADGDPAWSGYIRDNATNNPREFLHPWLRLSSAQTPDEFRRIRTELLGNLRAQGDAVAAATRDAICLDDFESEGYDRWYVTGRAFGRGPTRGGELLLGAIDSDPGLLPAGWAHSGRSAGKLQGALRSETFTIEKHYIHTRAARWFGAANSGLQLKNGQINLIVDGFQYIRDPLYGSFSVNVPNDGQWRWHTQDLDKFIGKRAYLEILDQDDGTIAVDTILFSDSPAPPEPPSPALLALLERPALASPRDLAAAYVKLLDESLTRWVAGTLAQGDDARCHIEVLNWLIVASPQSVHELAPEAFQALTQWSGQRAALVERLTAPTPVLAMTDGTPENEHVLVRGNPAKLGPKVDRRFLEVFIGGEPESLPAGSGRLQLARDIANPDNPLTARVLVNRLWQHHFGNGLVASVDNFGRLGESPTHPELLDYLATEFVQSGWSIKHMQRLMLLSRTYQMSSAITDPAAERADPQNKLLHRMSVSRLEGEVIRDALLALSGRLDRRMYYPSVPPHLTDFMEGRGRPAQSGPLDGDGRASIYINVRRNFLTPMFLAFDYPTPLSTVGRRSVSNVPAQALTMMNNPLVLQQSCAWAEHALAAAPNDDRKRILFLYESALAREPTETEVRQSLEFLREQQAAYDGFDEPAAWTDLCHVLVNLKEFVFIP